MTKRGPKAGSPEAQRGGQKVKEKYGIDFYRKIGKKGGNAVKAKYGPGYY